MAGTCALTGVLIVTFTITLFSMTFQDVYYEYTQRSKKNQMTKADKTRSLLGLCQNFIKQHNTLNTRIKKFHENLQTSVNLQNELAQMTNILSEKIEKLRLGEPVSLDDIEDRNEDKEKQN